MKRTLLILIASILTDCTFGQNQNSFGIGVGSGSGVILKPPADNESSYVLNVAHSFELKYLRKVNDKLNFETGIAWYKNNVTFTPFSDPESDVIPTDYDIKIIYIPLFMKFNFGKRYFINTGLIGDIDVSNKNHLSKQSGVGIGLGVGIEYSIFKTFILTFNPYTNLHGTIMTTKESYPTRILDIGLKLVMRTD
jgi:hypothetical protein